MSTNKFINQIAAEMISAVNNNFNDNYDYYRYGKLNISKSPFSIKKSFVRKINDYGYFNDFNNHIFSNQVREIQFPYTDFLYLYDLLEDEYSKSLLVKIIVYRILGHTKIRLPLNTASFWQDLKTIESKQNVSDFIQIDFMNMKLHLNNLDYLGLPIKIYYNALAINIDFIIKQYEFHRDGIDILAVPGDIVIDAGGCFGDTALYFANLVGPTGQVKAFEFIPNNISIFNRNINLNPTLSPVIELVEHPLWNVSDLKVFFKDNGPGSNVSLDYFEGHTGITSTITIDDYVKKSGIAKVDFIKMDIEGAETNSLQGAAETIKKYKPKLAIALYHSTKDFDSIPRFINQLGLGYRFYLSHATIYGEETMLFATI